jgi:hypothetical protein
LRILIKTMAKVSRSHKQDSLAKTKTKALSKMTRHDQTPLNQGEEDKEVAEVKNNEVAEANLKAKA